MSLRSRARAAGSSRFQFPRLFFLLLFFFFFFFFSSCFLRTLLGCVVRRHRENRLSETERGGPVHPVFSVFFLTFSYLFLPFLLLTYFLPFSSFFFHTCLGFNVRRDGQNRRSETERGRPVPPGFLSPHFASFPFFYSPPFFSSSFFFPFLAYVLGFDVRRYGGNRRSESERGRPVHPGFVFCLLRGRARGHFTPRVCLLFVQQIIHFWRETSIFEGK